MRVVAEQVGFDQDIGDVVGVIVGHARCDEQRLGELDRARKRRSALRAVLVGQRDGEV